MSDLGNKEVFSRNLQELMNNRGVSAKQICEDLGFTPSAFSLWKNGTYYPRIDKIEMLANYFHVKKSDLIESKSDVMSPNQLELIELYGQMDETARERVLAYAKAIFNIEQLEDITKEDKS